MILLRSTSAILLMLVCSIALADRLTCESRRGERAYCRADISRGVALVKQLSRSPCNRGSTWGIGRDEIWVDRGCRAVFATDVGPRRHGREDRRPDLDLSRHGSGRVSFANNCVVYYRHGRRTDQTRECSGHQVRWADNAVDDYLRDHRNRGPGYRGDSGYRRDSYREDSGYREGPDYYR
jgi:hypothetical protein